MSETRKPLDSETRCSRFRIPLASEMGTRMNNRWAERTDLKVFASEVRTRANGQFATPQHQRLFEIPLTLERAQVWALQMSFWTTNRRDCWAFAQALAPLEVKRLIWEHEQDELAGNKTRGVGDHRSLSLRQGALVNLTIEDYRNTRIREGTRTCTYAWMHLVRDSHWLKSVSACAALEISNSAEWVDGGGMSYRRGKLYEQYLGIPFEKQVSHKEHAEVDVEHANMLVHIAEQYGTTKQALDLILEGLIESWEIETVWKGQIAEMIAAVGSGVESTPRLQ
jgi:hypothetical protein